jgi:hypothetical protein
MTSGSRTRSTEQVLSGRLGLGAEAAAAVKADGAR